MHALERRGELFDVVPPPQPAHTQLLKRARDRAAPDSDVVIVQCEAWTTEPIAQGRARVSLDLEIDADLQQRGVDERPHAAPRGRVLRDRLTRTGGMHVSV